MPDLALLWASWRWRLRPLARWMAVAVVAAVAVTTFVALGRQAAGAKAAWGDRQAVAVAVADLPAGHVLSAGDVRTVELPVARWSRPEPSPSRRQAPRCAAPSTPARS